jgi:hypothetical protein
MVGRWVLEMGFWSHLAGDQYGQTQTVYTPPEDGDAALATWNHPIDVHLTTSSIQGWPRIIVQVSGPHRSTGMLLRHKRNPPVVTPGFQTR